MPQPPLLARRGNRAPVSEVYYCPYNPRGPPRLFLSVGPTLGIASVRRLAAAFLQPSGSPTPVLSVGPTPRDRFGTPPYSGLLTTLGFPHALDSLRRV